MTPSSLTPKYDFNSLPADPMMNVLSYLNRKDFSSAKRVSRAINAIGKANIVISRAGSHTKEIALFKISAKPLNFTISSFQSTLCAFNSEVAIKSLVGGLLAFENLPVLATGDRKLPLCLEANVPLFDSEGHILPQAQLTTTTAEEIKSFLNLTEMTHDIMRGGDVDGRQFIATRIYRPYEATAIQLIFQVTNSWENCVIHPSYIIQTFNTSFLIQGGVINPKLISCASRFFQDRVVNKDTYMQVCLGSAPKGSYREEIRYTVEEVLDPENV